MLPAPEDTFVRVILVDTEGKLLIQKRSSSKRLYPGVWEYAAGGRKEMGEGWEDAALRELEEELGIRKSKGELREILQIVLDASFVGRPLSVRIYTAPYCNEPVTANPREVETVRFITPAELRHELEQHPERFIPGMTVVMERCWGVLNARD